MSEATCKPIFFKYGWPDTLVSDKGPYHAAIKFRQVTDDMSVHHTITPLHYHQ